MNHHKCLPFALTLLLLPSLASAKDESLISRMQNIQSSIVSVRTVFEKELTTQSGRRGIASYERNGAGIIIDPSGIIVTNTHIVINAPKILVALSNGKVYEATTLYASEADFSFIKIDTGYPLPPIEWADSSQAQLGEPIIAIGNSEYNNQSILGGEITSLLESISSNTIEMIELNLNLYKGDSGGPILNQHGQFLGLIMAKRTTQDRKSYAIASDKIRQEYLKLH